jgi:hypothetical protein
VHYGMRVGTREVDRYIKIEVAVVIAVLILTTSTNLASAAWLPDSPHIDSLPMRDTDCCIHVNIVLIMLLLAVRISAL